MTSQFRIADMYKKCNEKTLLFQTSVGSVIQGVLFHKCHYKHI